jgi:MFS family permease
VSCFTLGLIVAGLAPSMGVLIAGRAVQGLGAGVIGSVAYAAIGRGYPEALKPRMLAVIASAWVVPGLIGPALAGLIAEHVGWRWVFLGLAPLPLIAACLAWPALRHFAPTTAAPREWSRINAALRLSVGAGLLVSGLGLTSLLGALLAAVGFALGLPALRRLLPPGALHAAPGLPAAIATHGLLNLAFFGVDAFVPLALTVVRGQSVAAAGIPLTAATICWTTGAWLQAHFAPRRGRRPLVIIGLAITALGILITAATLNPAVPALLATVGWGVAGLGVGLAFSTLALVVLESAPAGQEGASSSGMQLASALGVALGAGIGGVIVAALGGERTPGRGILIQDALMIGVLLLAVLTASRLRNRPTNSAQR